MVVSGAIFFYHHHYLQRLSPLQAVIEVFHEIDGVFYLRIAIDVLVPEDEQGLLYGLLVQVLNHQIQGFFLAFLGAQIDVSVDEGAIG